MDPVASGKHQNRFEPFNGQFTAPGEKAKQMRFPRVASVAASAFPQAAIPAPQLPDDPEQDVTAGKDQKRPMIVVWIENLESQQHQESRYSLEPDEPDAKPAVQPGLQG